ncbi:type II toxin-antitoxin system RelE/ParE family toxin [Photobacterium rosenbergii]|uniref:type II toxin-antitoxin system RelE/ParE family toxin n=1 Tax=Photobacterium rosenbergii TaxID=294936 RepID=UPI001C991870|nr:type II toxin-antitoxin system RelE/ParE family toxin [Photobacterium rosenbergii]MBY5946019.1 type II toxin-antitoxin system RelE/ParE family toxin [Photobacterium rosenbergii]
MKIFIVDDTETAISVPLILNAMPHELRISLFNKLNTYVEHGDIYSCKNLKVLKPKIWKYKGTIYKLRVDAGKESIRVLFVKSKEGDIVIIHVFVKTTRKTPQKEAYRAITVNNLLYKLEKKLYIS